MSETHQDELRRAAAPAYRRIDRDLERAGSPTKKILRFLRDNLFDPGLSVDRVRRVLGLRSNDVTTRFRVATGQTIKRYIISRRLEAACRLLLQTTLSTHEVARAVGWRAFRSFSHTFNKRLGCRPRAYRASGGLMSRRPPRTKRPSLEPAPAGPAAGLPRFVAGMAAVGKDDRCARCRARVDPSPGARVFEDRRPLCPLCAFEHAPRELVDFLFVHAPGRLAAPAEEVERLADPERAAGALGRQLSREDAEALLWALACRHPHAAGVVRGLLDLQGRERDRRLGGKPAG